MNKKLYCMLPDIDSCKQLVAELRQHEISDKHIHAIARQDIQLDDLHEATLEQKTELTHGVGLGIGIGGVGGMLGGLLAVTFPPAGLALAGGSLLVLVTALAGAGLGTIVSVLVASDIPNHELEAFQDAISQGQVLLIVDLPAAKIEHVSGLIKQYHPEARLGITDRSVQVTA